MKTNFNIENVNIDSLTLLDINPRYSSVSELNNIFNISFKINKTEEQIIKDIIDFELLEENKIDDFIELCNSLLENGYDPSGFNAEIIVIKNELQNIVIEGNRRTLALKLLNNPSKYGKLIEESIINSEGSIENKAYRKWRKWFQENSFESKINFSEIRTKLYLLQEGENTKEIQEELFQMLNSYHIVNERKGFKRWNRFLNLMNKNFDFREYIEKFKNENSFSPEGSNDLKEKALEKLSNRYKTKLATIENDINTSFWIKLIFEKSSKNLLWDLNDKNNSIKKFIEIIKNEKLSCSPLELSLSSIKFNDVSLREKLNYKKYSIKSGEVIEPSIDYENIWNYNKFFNNLIEAQSKTMFTTRGWKDYNNISFLFSCFKDEMFQENIDDLNPWNFYKKISGKEEKPKNVKEVEETINKWEKEQKNSSSHIEKQVLNYFKNVYIPLKSEKKLSIKYNQKTTKKNDYFSFVIFTYNDLIKNELEPIIKSVDKSSATIANFPYFKFFALYRSISEMIFQLFHVEHEEYMKENNKHLFDEKLIIDEKLEKEKWNNLLIKKEINKIYVTNREKLKNNINSFLKSEKKNVVPKTSYKYINSLLQIDKQILSTTNALVHKPHYIGVVKTSKIIEEEEIIFHVKKVWQAFEEMQGYLNLVSENK